MDSQNRTLTAGSRADLDAGALPAGLTARDRARVEQALEAARSENTRRTYRAADLAAGIAGNGGSSLAGLRDAALILAGSDGLLRVSELAALDWADLDLDGPATTETRRCRRGRHSRTGWPTGERRRPLCRSLGDS